MSAPEIFVEKTNRGVRIVNKSNKKIKVVTVTLIYRYTVTSATTKTQSESPYLSKTGSERMNPMKDLEPGSSFEVEFYPPDILVSVELVVESDKTRHIISRNLA
ncbi:hypothetical protein ATG_17990 [Desulfurococcaceae archaeon AG1]|jgi:hypothetical protein|nr:MAG: hypothetical protein DJ555_05835 [Desulfurococcaceae archaeon]GAY26595.1 hypothetical protein ATG_17990 [Desulfurococcaceae archaeon AG1]